MAVDLRVIRRAVGISIGLTLFPTCALAEPIWHLVGNLGTARHEHSTVPLANGKVLVTGGLISGSSSRGITSAEVYDPVSRTWSLVPPMAVPRYGHSSTVLPNGKVLVTGAEPGVTPFTASAELYDPSTNSWTPAGSLSHGRGYHAATLLLDGRVLVTARSFGPAEGELYDPATNSWSSTGPMFVARVWHTATLLLDGRVLVTGGHDPLGRPTTSVEMFDPATNSWTLAQSLHVGRYFHQAQRLPDGRVIVIGGFPLNPSSVEIYDPATNSWSMGPPMAVVRYYPYSAALRNGKILVAGGASSFGWTRTAEIYDPVLNAWSLTASLNVTTTNFHPNDAIRMPDGTVFIAGGNDGRGNRLTTSELYVASAPPVANAGPDQTVHAGQTVLLDGAGSFDDDTPTSNLAFAWTISARPEGSGAVLTGSATATPSLVVDVPGDYVISLTVTDADGLTSAPDTLLISSMNAAPIADAGPDQATFVGSRVTLTGAGSHDPDGDPLTFLWQLAAPAGSAAVLADGTTPSPTFVPDMPGAYSVTLTVSDGRGGQAMDAVVVSVITASEYAEGMVAEALNVVGALPPSSVTNAGNQQALEGMLTRVIADVQDGDLARARATLIEAIERVDGCSLRGTPDGNGAGRDWVTDCGAQMILYDQLTAALDALTP